MSVGRYKPYPKYKDSGVKWLGPIPSDWKLCPLKFLAKIKNGQDYKHVEADTGYPVMGSGGRFTFASKFMYEKESVLLGRKGTIDKPLYINERFWTVDTMYYTEIDDSACAKFVYYLALIIQFKKFSTNTALPSMTQEHLGSYVFAVPSDLPEQTQIAAFLDHETAKIDRLIEKQQALIRLLKEKRQAVISHAVTKGLNPHAPLKDSGIEWLGQVPAHWTVSKLGYLCSVQTGARDTEHAVEEGKFPFFVRSQTIERINSKSFDCEAVLTAGDGAGVGKVFHHYTGPFDFHQRVYMMNNFQGISGRFFFHYFRELFYRVALEGGAKSTVDSLRRPMLTSFPVCVPPVNEQEEIIQSVERKSAHFDILTANAEQGITLLQERRTALISAAVTGKIDVRHWQPAVSSILEPTATATT